MKKLLLVVLSCLFFWNGFAQAQDCINYDDYIHHVSFTAASSWVNDVVIRENFAFIADGDFGLKVFDISDPKAPVLEGALSLAGQAMDIELFGDYACVAAGEAGVHVLDISSTQAPYLVGSVGLGASGFFLPVEEIIVVGDYGYTRTDAEWNPSPYIDILDLSDPSSPSIAGYYYVEHDSNSRSVSAIAATEDYLYITDIVGDLHVASLADPSAPVAVAWLDHVSGLRLAVSGNYLYSMGHRYLDIVDISNPIEPVEVTISNDPIFWLGERFVIRDDLVYLAACSPLAYSHSLNVIDVSDLSMPTVIANYYTMRNAYSIGIYDEYAFIGETDGLETIDISNPTDPPISSMVDLQTDIFDLVVRDDYLFIAAGDAGLNICQYVADPLGSGSMALVSAIDTPGEALAIALAGDYIYLVTDDMLYVIDATDTLYPEISSQLIWPENIYDDDISITIAAGHAYISRGSGGGVYVVDVSNPRTPYLTTTMITPDCAYGMAISGDYGYLAGHDSGLLVVDVSIPAYPVIVGNEAGHAREVVLDQQTLYVAFGNAVAVVNVDDPIDPQIISSVTVPSSPKDILVQEDCLYVATAHGGVQVIKISNPSNPQLVGARRIPTSSTNYVSSCADFVIAGGELSSQGSVFALKPQCPFVFSDTSMQEIETDSIELHNSPNPFSSRTTISYFLESAGVVDLRIYDISGRLVRVLTHNRHQPAGDHFTEWDGCDDTGRDAPVGIYFCRIDTGDTVGTKRLIVR
jgi:hypothetical protein